jgi:general secretion pathway protein D
MLSERGQVTASKRGNALVVVDYGSTVQRIGEIIGRLDQDGSTVRTVKLSNSSATEMARLAQSMAAGVGEDANTRGMLQAAPIASSNTLVLRGDKDLIDRIAPVIEQLDAGARIDSGVQVISLRYALAEDLVPVLQQVSAAMTAQTAADGQPQPGRSANIAAHKATNSLIINASRDTQEALARVVRSLDIRREQVLVEAIIVEVSDTAARDLGLQFLLSGDGDSAVPFLSTSFGGNAPNLLALTGALTLRDSGDDGEDSSALTELRQAAVRSLLNVTGALGGIGGRDDDGALFGVILRALAEDRDSNVLSTPSVMTLDNETASILVGQQIPITTGETLSGNNDNPFRTVQRQDVGVQLKVRPQISEDGAIRMEISQEVSSIFGPITQDSSDLITNRRLINTTVQADPGQIIVLGGLIQEDVQRTEQGVPGLRRVPVAGRLFRSEGQSRRRTNLMVFLRPTVVNTAAQAGEVTRRQFDALRAYQGLDPGLLNRLQREIEAPTRPAAPPIAAAPQFPAPAPPPAAAVRPSAAPLATAPVAPAPQRAAPPPPPPAGLVQRVRVPAPPRAPIAQISAQLPTQRMAPSAAPAPSAPVTVVSVSVVNRAAVRASAPSAKPVLAPQRLAFPRATLTAAPTVRPAPAPGPVVFASADSIQP